MKSIRSLLKKDIFVAFIPVIITSLVLIFVFMDIGSVVQTSKFTSTEKIIHVKNLSKICLMKENYNECVQLVNKNKKSIIKIIKRKDGTAYLQISEME